MDQILLQFDDEAEETKTLKIEANPFYLNLRKGHEFVKNPLREDVWGILGAHDDDQMEDEEDEEDEDDDGEDEQTQHQ